jgi:hypothetical protein
MKFHICIDCEKSFKQKSHLDYHVTNKACKDMKYNCTFCNKGFTTDTSMYRHMKHTCKIKKAKECEKEMIYEKLLELEEQNKKYAEENELLKKRVEMIENGTSASKMSGINVNGNGNVINMNNITNNYVLIGYGKEDLSKISRNEMFKGMKEGFYSTVSLLDVVHFNPEYPEYHNIYISSMKNKYAMMYDGTNWTLVMKDYLIDKIYKDKKNYIEDNLDDFFDALTVSQRNALDRWMNTDDEHVKIREIKDKIKLLLYNKRGIVTDSLNSNQIVHNPIIMPIEKEVGVIKYKDNNVKKDKDVEVIVKEKVAPKLGTKRKNYVKAVKNK